MRLLLRRLYDNGNDTIGILYYMDVHGDVKYVTTIEDEYREKKVRGETRIPSGEYKIKMRTEGGFYNKYLNHKNKGIKQLTENFGIPWLQDVPGFEYVLIHIGNDEDDTMGCILVGSSLNNNSMEKGKIGNSTGAYIQLMYSIGEAVKLQEDITIEIIDYDKDLNILI